MREIVRIILPFAFFFVTLRLEKSTTTNGQMLLPSSEGKHYGKI